MKRCLLFFALLTPALCPSLHAQPQPPAELNLSTEKEGVRLRIKQARWIAANEYQKNFSMDGDKRARVFQLEYDWSVDGKTDYDEQTALVVDGERLTWWTASYGGGSSRGIWKSFNPHAREATLEVTLTKRGKPEEMGNFPFALDFGTISLPAAGDTVPVGKTLTATLGSKVTLDSVAHIAAQGTLPAQIILKLRRESPAAPADMAFTFGLDSAKTITDDAGKSLIGGRSTSSNFPDGGVILAMQEKPPAPGTALHITITGIESAPSLALPQTTKVARLKFDPSWLPRPPADSDAPTIPLATGTSAALDVSFEQFERSQATLWLRDKKPQPARVWELDSWTAGENRLVVSNSHPLFWKAYGKIPAANEAGLRTSLNTSEEVVPIPATLRFRPLKQSTYNIALTDVPFPDKDGEALTINKSLRLPDGGTVVITRALRFDAAHPLRDEQGNAQRISALGLAFVVEYRAPDGPHSTAAQRTAKFTLIGARDNEGRNVGPVRDNNSGFAEVAGDAIEGGMPDALHQTWLRAIPAPNARTISFEAALTVRAPDGDKVEVFMQ